MYQAADLYVSWNGAIVLQMYDYATMVAGNLYVHLFFARTRMSFAVHYDEVEFLLRIPYSMHSSREELEALIS